MKDIRLSKEEESYITELLPDIIETTDLFFPTTKEAVEKAIMEAKDKEELSDQLLEETKKRIFEGKITINRKGVNMKKRREVFAIRPKDPRIIADLNKQRKQGSSPYIEGLLLMALKLK